MRTLRFLLQKEFRQIFRNPTILRMIMVLPIVQLIILPLAADYEIKNVNIAIVDHDHSTSSQKLIGEIGASRYFSITDYGSSFAQSYELFQRDKADLILEIPQNFERTLVREGHENYFLAVNAINGTKAIVGSNYLSRIVNDFNANLRLQLLKQPLSTPPQAIEAAAINWYNPLLNYRLFMVPGILVFLITMVATYMCALNIVKEKEIGTIEQINVTPVKKYHFILGKLIPFWLIGMLIFTLGLFIVARLVYGIVPVGSVLLLYAYLAIYLVAMLGFGLLISTYSNTQQQAMSLAFFFVMIFLLMSGLFTSIDSMPTWARWIALANPVTYFIEVMRMVVLKGSGFADVKLHFFAMLGFAIVFNGWAVMSYKKVSG